MSDFKSTDYGPIAACILDIHPAAVELGPGTPSRAARELLHRLTPEGLVAPGRLRDRSSASACCAGLWLWHNYLDESHALSQSIETPEGSFWHGIMHRREPDPANAKYWFRQVRQHPAFVPLRRAAAGVAEQSGQLERPAAFLATQSGWDPYRWIDLCEQARVGDVSPATADLCRRAQVLEWRILFDYCFRRAM
jgi:hypothetical protein